MGTFQPLLRQERVPHQITRRFRARLCGLRRSPTRPATGRGACRRRRTRRGPTSCSSSSVATLPRASSSTPSCSIMPLCTGPSEAHGQQHQIGVQRRTRCPAIGSNFGGGPTRTPCSCFTLPLVVAGELRGRRRSSRACRLLRASFRCATASATAATASTATRCVRRLRHDFELMHRDAPSGDGCAQAIGAGVAAADDDHALAGGQDPGPGPCRLRCACSAAAGTPSRNGCPSARARARSGRAAARRRPPAGWRRTRVRRSSDRNVDADVRVGDELHAFGRHLLQAAVDEVLLHLEIRECRSAAGRRCGRLFSNTVTAWPARASCCAAASPAGPEPITATRLPVRIARRFGRIQPSSKARSMMVFSICLMVTGGSLMPSTQDGFARRRTDASGELREVVGGVQTADRFLPAAAIDQIVPVGNDVGERAAGVAERHAAIHAARALRAAPSPRETAGRFRTSR